ncbi:MAG: UDP-N-acetylmuramoyl-tripeptide--D-alanyl-D-alanine ligase [Thiomargarita sp.]|nr:UDP-N-acetylmuramoyl-tripeptide--D-alanyl-D-alanine ligase [Thiomargarita sp.]
MITLTLSDIASALSAVISEEHVRFTGCSTDTRNLQAGALYIALRGKNFDGHNFVTAAKTQGASALLVDTSVNCELPTIQVANTRKALGQLAQFWRQRFDIPLVAITGSNGKTTTKELLRAILSYQDNEVLATQGNFNNDIGVPLTLFNLHAKHRYAVIEMGANHAGEIAGLTQIAQPSCAVITQCAPAHLEGFGSIKGVALAKGEIFSNLKPNGISVINNDDNYATLWHELAGAHQINTFGITHEADVKAINITLHQDSSDFTLKTKIGDIAIHLPLPGQHNIMNALAASTCALACNCTLHAIQHSLQRIDAVKGRLQRQAGIQNMTLIDDTYNANPASLTAALTVLNNTTPPYWLVLGDMNELGTESIRFHREAGLLAREFGVERLWAIGDMSRYAVESFGAGAQHFTQHKDLIQALLQTVPLPTTLLIKGSRGMHMEQVVNALKENA